MSIQRTFAGSKYQSMFVSGTVMMVLTAVMGMIDTLIAGIMLGEDAVAGVFSLGPVYPDEIRPEELPAFPRGSGKNKKAALYDFAAVPETVIRVRDEIEALLKENGCTDRLVNTVCLTFEELFMLICDCNPGKTVLAECMVEIGDTIRLITKDNGQIIDLTDPDREIGSLRAYALSNMLEAHTTRRVHFLVLSFNHNILEIR